MNSDTTTTDTINFDYFYDYIKYIEKSTDSLDIKVILWYKKQDHNICLTDILTKFFENEVYSGVLRQYISYAEFREIRDDENNEAKYRLKLGEVMVGHYSEHYEDDGCDDCYSGGDIYFD